MSETTKPVWEVIVWEGHAKVVRYATFDGWLMDSGKAANDLAAYLNRLEALAGLAGEMRAAIEPLGEDAAFTPADSKWWVRWCQAYDDALAQDAQAQRWRERAALAEQLRYRLDGPEDVWSLVDWFVAAYDSIDALAQAQGRRRGH